MNKMDSVIRAHRMVSFTFHLYNSESVGQHPPNLEFDFFNINIRKAKKCHVFNN